VTKELKLQRQTLKVLRALAEFRDTSLAELMEQLIQSAFDGTVALSEEDRAVVSKLIAIYGQATASGQSAPTALRRKSNGPQGRGAARHLLNSDADSLIAVPGGALRQKCIFRGTVFGFFMAASYTRFWSNHSRSCWASARWSARSTMDSAVSVASNSPPGSRVRTLVVSYP
jgi:hypothetical protein